MWAFIYNILLILVAAGVLYPTFAILLSPILAAMGLSDLFVVGNALRLKRLKLPMPHAVKEVRSALVQTPRHAA